ncbi:hypothetical protein FB451DRAFT_1387459 [Mycena latifolia]|nr:hypothetical protein FB451DRAFT_1387459 [Mycena latifolia]
MADADIHPSLRLDRISGLPASLKRKGDLLWASNLLAGIITFTTVSSARDGFPGQLGLVLLARGIAANITAAIYALNLSIAVCARAPEILDQALLLLRCFLTTSPTRSSISTALEAGLLGALVLSAKVDSPHIKHHLNVYFTQLLPGYMAYRSVLLHMEKALLEAEDLAPTGGLFTSDFNAVWKRFSSLTRERLELLITFDSTPQISYRECDSVKCAKICAKNDLRRCSGCLDLYYCSKHCQVDDWRANHRRKCKIFRPVRHLLRAGAGALLHRDYLTHRATLWARQISNMNEPLLRLPYF